MAASGASQVALGVKNPPANAGETWVQPLGQEDPLEEGMAIHSSILAWRIRRGAWWATVHGVAKHQTSNAPNPVESREAPPTSSFPDFSEPP